MAQGKWRGQDRAVMNLVTFSPLITMRDNMHVMMYENGEAFGASIARRSVGCGEDLENDTSRQQQAHQ
jgi:hypothetical protein